MQSPLSRFVTGLVLLAPMLSPAHALEVRTAAQDSQPKFIKSGNSVSGLCVDVFRAIERVDPDLKFSALTNFMPLPRIEASMVEGSLDAFCGLAKTQDRLGKFDFIEPPVYSTHTVLAARTDEKADPQTFDELRNLGNDTIVLVAAQTVHEDVLKKQPGIKVDAGGKSTSINLQKLLQNRGRFVFHNDFALADDIKRDNLAGKVKILSAKFVSEGRYFAVSKAAPAELKAKLAAAMDKLSKTGELKKIFEAYQPK